MSDSQNQTIPPYPTEPADALENAMNKLSILKQTGEVEKLKTSLKAQILQYVEGEPDILAIQRLPARSENEEVSDWMQRLNHIPVITNYLTFLGIEAIDINKIKHRDAIIGQTQAIADRISFYNLEDIRMVLRLLELSEDEVLSAEFYKSKRLLSPTPGPEKDQES